MRIISGKHKGRKLISPKNSARPTADKVKEALFDIIHYSVKGAMFLDLFAGSGAIGIEAMSRGADVIFCDNDSESIKLIKDNLKLINEQGKVIQKEAQECIKYLFGQGSKFDIIFIDPPYISGCEKDVLQTLLKYPIMYKNAKIIIEHFARNELIIPLDYYIITDVRKYGNTKLTFLNYSERQ